MARIRANLSPRDSTRSSEHAGDTDQILREVLRILVIFGQLYEVEGGMGEGRERYWSIHRLGRQRYPCACHKRQDALRAEPHYEFGCHEYYMVDSNDEFVGHEYDDEYLQEIARHEDDKVTKDSVGQTGK
jgi:hypothetical protein